MKIFVIKTLIILISIFVLFQLTIGSLVNSLKKDLSDQLSREKIILMKDKIREEMKEILCHNLVEMILVNVQMLSLLKRTTRLFF